MSREVVILDPSKLGTSVLEQVVLSIDVKDAFLKLVGSLIFVTFDRLQWSKEEGRKVS